MQHFKVRRQALSIMAIAAVLLAIGFVAGPTPQAHAATIVVTPAGTPTDTDNDFTRIQTAVAAAANGDIIDLQGTFDWTEPYALADYTASFSASASSDIRGVEIPSGVNNLTITSSTNDAHINGAGDIADGTLIYSAFMFADDSTTPAALGNTNLIMEKLWIDDFEAGIVLGWNATGIFDGTLIQNNTFVLAGDDGDATDWIQNIAIYFWRGYNQTVRNNTVTFQADGTRTLGYGGNPKNGASFGFQNATSGGNAYNGLLITNNVFQVGSTSNVIEETYGIWENSHNDTAGTVLTLSNNQFLGRAGDDFDHAFLLSSQSDALSIDGNIFTGVDDVFYASKSQGHTVGDAYSFTNSVATRVGGADGIFLRNVTNDLTPIIIKVNWDIDNTVDGETGIRGLNELSTQATHATRTLSAASDIAAVFGQGAQTTTAVDDNWGSPDRFSDPDGIGTGADPVAYGFNTYTTIQTGIDAVTNSTVYVAAGTYVEDLLIDKAVTLLGPNAAINPNTGSRVAEAMIISALTDPDPSGGCQLMVSVEVSDVTIKGFTIDGDNPALTSGIIINGADVDACELVSGYEGVGNIVVENNILKHSTYSGVEFYNYTNPAATAGNYIRYNRFEDIGETTYNWGIGVLVYNNFYADITDNVMTGVRTGVQTGNYYNANPGTTGSISNNQIGVWRLGIFHNLAYGSASPFTISGNTITAETYPGATKWNGLLLSSIGGAVDATITGNDIVIPGAVSFAPPNYTAGYNVWNVTTTAPIAISGGTVTGGDYGVFVNNYEGYSSNANSTAVKIDGVTILGSDIAGVYVKDSPSNTNNATVYANIQNSALNTDAIGILVEGADATANANLNQIAGNPTYGVNNTSGNLMDAENNFWGACDGPGPVGPGSGDNVSVNVDYDPFVGSAPAGILQALIDAAAPGDTIDLGTCAPYQGATVDKPLTINLNGSTIGEGSPGLTISADDVRVNGPGVLDGNGSTDPGILVNGGADNFILDGVEVREWADGVQLAGSVTSFKLVNNWIHSNNGALPNTGAGLQIDSGVTVGGIVTIEGNLFKVNGGNGVQNDSGNTVNATYNSWGADQGPTAAGGDGVSADVTYDPWTFAEVYIDVDPTTGGDQIVRGVDESTSFNVDLNVDGENLYGLSFKFTYNPAFLTFNGPPTFAAPWAGNCVVVGTPPAGTFAYNCYLISGPAWTGGTVATFNFTANGPSLTGNGPWPTYFDISHLEADTNAGAAGGVKVFVNNAGFNDPSTPDRDITDANDGRIDITGIAQFTGFVDLQGRPNDSGAVVEVYNQLATSGATLLANGTSVSSGSYTTNYISPNLLTVDTTYYLQIDRPLYLPTTIKNPMAANWTNMADLTTRPLTTLSTVVLLGGDATDDDVVNSFDLTCIGGDYLGAPAVCSAPTSSSDVNGDGAVNILDLTLAGGNFYKLTSPWTP